jgi:broad specificity phosphatase PhoE
VVDRVESFLVDLARGWGGARIVVVGHAATRWALDCLLHGESLAALVEAPFNWRGWLYVLPSDGPGRRPVSGGDGPRWHVSHQ